MKKSFLVLVALLLIPSLCSCVSDISNTELSQESSEAAEPFVAELSAKTVLQSEKIVKITNDASKITDEEAYQLASSLYTSLADIAKEFYGFPNYLTYDTPKDGFSASEPYFAKVIEVTEPKCISGISFKNDADQINSVLKTYLSEDLIALAFNLQQPCPIYIQDGELYRTVYEPNTSNRAVDLKAGKIISRENGAVRFVFPAYNVNYDTNVPESENNSFDYMDFVYENGGWKINDFRLVGSVYNHTQFPAGKAVINEADYFVAKLEMNKDGVTAILSESKKAEITVDGKTVKTELKNKSGKIKEITQSGDNIFVTFTGVIGNDETVVVSKANGDIVSQFNSHGFCTKGNDWYYLRLDYENKHCDLLDKEGKAIHGFGVVHYDKSEVAAYAIHDIAAIDGVELANDIFTVTFEAIYEEKED